MKAFNMLSSENCQGWVPHVACLLVKASAWDARIDRREWWNSDAKREEVRG